MYRLVAKKQNAVNIVNQFGAIGTNVSMRKGGNRKYYHRIMNSTYDRYKKWPVWGISNRTIFVINKEVRLSSMVSK